MFLGLHKVFIGMDNYLHQGKCSNLLELGDRVENNSECDSANSYGMISVVQHLVYSW